MEADRRLTITRRATAGEGGGETRDKERRRDVSMSEKVDAEVGQRRRPGPVHQSERCPSATGPAAYSDTVVRLHNDVHSPSFMTHRRRRDRDGR